MDYIQNDLAALPIEFIKILVDNNRKIFSHLNAEDVYINILKGRFSLDRQPRVGLLFLLDSEKRTLKLVAHQGINEADLRQKSIDLRQSAIGKVAANGHKHISYDSDSWNEIFSNNFSSISQLETSIILPLQIIGGVIGVLNFYLEGTNPVASYEEVMLDILAGHAAVAIQNANLYNRLKVDHDDLDSIAQIAKDLTSSLNLKQVLHNILKAAQQISNTNTTFLWYQDLTTKKWKRAFPESLKLQDVPLPKIEEGEGIIGHVFKTGRPYLCNDVTKDPYYFNIWNETRSEITVPVIIDNSVKGVLDIENPRYDAYTERDLRVLMMLAGEAAIALRNAQLFEIAERKTRQFITLKQVSEALSQQKSLDAILSIIAQESLNIVGQGNKSCFVMLVDKEKNMLETKAVSGDIKEKSYLDFVVDLNQDKGIVVWVAKNGKPRIANNVTHDPEYLNIFPDTKSEICIPLLFRNEVIGVIDIESSKIDAFGDHDVEILLALADNTAIATKIGELCDIRLRQLQVLYETGKKVTSSLDLDEVLNLLANEALSAIGAKDRILYVQLINQEKGITEIKAVAGERASPQNYINRKSSITEGLSGHVIRTRKHYLCTNVELNEHYLEINPAIKSELIVPIFFNQAVIGLINVESFKKNDFGQYEVHLLQQLANQAGIAIENARLNEKLADAQFQLTEAIGITMISDALAGLTHDIRTASALISGEAQWIEYLHESSQLQTSQVIESMKKIESHVDRIETMTSDLMERGRSLPPKFVKANLADITRTAVRLTSGYAQRQNVEITAKYHSLDFAAQVDPHRLYRVFINLIKNAIEAIPNGGTISIRAKKFTDYFDIHFADSGKGIEIENQKKIWKPFFSLKQRGFGLGLTNCKRIIEVEHNGKITIRSVKNRGTNVKLRLPYDQE